MAFDSVFCQMLCFQYYVTYNVVASAVVHVFLGFLLVVLFTFTFLFKPLTSFPNNQYEAMCSSVKGMDPVARTILYRWTNMQSSELVVVTTLFQLLFINDYAAMFSSQRVFLTWTIDPGEGLVSELITGSDCPFITLV